MENVKEELHKHKKFRTDNKKLALLFFVVAILVVVIVFWWLKLVGITITGDAFCGMTEHTHADKCYASQLICGFTEDSSAPETHHHTDACYQKDLVCTLPEHTHTTECFPDTTADVETVSDWLATIEQVEITNNIPENLVNVALSQLGYTESTANFEFDGNGEKHGYTRYGEWYGVPYGSWDATFVSFCLHYSNIHEVDSLKAAGAEAMRVAWKTRLLYAEAADYTAQRGDVVFINADDDTDADRVAVVLAVEGEILNVIVGDSNNAVEIVRLPLDEHILGYGRTGYLSPEREMDDEAQTESENPEEPTVNINRPLMMMFSGQNENIIYTSDLTKELADVHIINHEGKEMQDGEEFHIGEPYIFELRFREINQGDTWRQFRADEDGYLTYPLPANVQCVNVDEWHSITAKTPDGDIRNVGQYCVDENNVLKVEFFETSNGEDFVDLYTNVEFNVEFSAIIPATTPGEETRIEFNEALDITLTPSGDAEMYLDKTIGDYDPATDTVEYTIRVEATHGMVKDLTLTDEIGENHTALRDTIVVTDLNGNPLDPQPIVGDHPQSWYNRGFSLSGFPDFVTGEGFLVTYKSQIDAELLEQDSVGLWNSANAYGVSFDGRSVSAYDDAWIAQEIQKIKKEGRQAFLTDQNGNTVPVIEWDVIIRKHDNDHQGTVLIDTLGEGLDYYTGKDVKITYQNENGAYLNETMLGWNQITVEGSRMSFALPDGNYYSCVVTYYTTYDEVPEGQEQQFSNRAAIRVNHNGQQVEEQTDATTTVVGIVPNVAKKASGNDGEYVKFTITASVPAVIKDWGSFYLTDDLSTWHEGGSGFLYAENIPQNLVVTAKTKSGDEITFTPYNGGSPENTYIFLYPAEKAQGLTYYSFRILFNTAELNTQTSKWLLDEDAELTISYQIPFDAITGTEWSGQLTGDKTIGDVLIEGGMLSNEVFFNYAEKLSVDATATYRYDPKITKNAVVNEDGTVDYTVLFNNDNHDTDTGYLNAKTLSAYFHDVFDEKMEYVPGSLRVTGYMQGDRINWLNTYKYAGDIQGNEMHISAEEFLYESTNPLHAGWTELYTYRNWEEFYSDISKGTYVFTYKLKFKDEYLYATDQNEMEADNVAEVTWDENGTSGPATAHATFNTGLLNKHLVREEDQLYFTVYVNRQGLDMDTKSDTIAVTDTMSETISVYWDTIQLYYQDGNDDWINFHSEDSLHTYTITYNQHTNTLHFVVPDALPVKIEYTTLVTETGTVTVHNTVSVDGKDHVTDYTDATFHIEGHSGSASGHMHEITLMKEDGDTGMPLPNVTLYLYGPMGDPKAIVPAGQPAFIIAESGEELYYIGAFTTGEDGTTPIRNQYLTEGGPYALVEHAPPLGYKKPDKPTYFYFYQHDPDGIIQMVTTIIAVDNFPYNYELPETGGVGTLPFGIIGMVCMAAPIVYSIIRRKRERRLSDLPP